MQHFLRSLREVSIYYITICYLHLLTTDRIQPCKTYFSTAFVIDFEHATKY